MKQGRLIIVAAPSGAGKTTLVRALLDSEDSLCVSVSHTTRPRRPREEDGVNYHFVDEKTFLGMLQDGDFLENAEVYGYHYGTSRHWLNEQRDSGRNVILEIDWQGAEQVRNLYPDSCSIFVLPPSLDTLTRRLRERAQDSEATIQKRMEQARSVIEHVCEADYIVVNDDFETALDDLRAIIRSTKLKVSAQQVNLAELLASLVKR